MKKERRRVRGRRADRALRPPGVWEMTEMGNWAPAEIAPDGQIMSV